MSRQKKFRAISVLVAFLLAFSGCQKKTAVQEISEFAPKEEYRTDGKAKEREEACFSFITNKMMSQGGVYTRYLESETKGSLAAGHEILAESEGFLLRYAVQRKDEKLYREVKDYITGVLQKDGYLSYRVDQKGKQMEVNACVDDLRIIRGLYEGGDRELAIQYAEQLQKTNFKKGFLTDFYTASDKQNADTVTLCYGDLKTMGMMSDELSDWQEIQKNTEKIMLSGYLSDEFPMFQTRYNIKTKKYTSEDIFMTEALLTTLHLAEVGKCPQKTIDWIEGALNSGEIYGRYTTDGEVTDKTESTAIYAICILIGQETGNQTIVARAEKCLEKFQIMEKTSELYGAFGEETDLNVYSFDNLTALTAFRTLTEDELQEKVAAEKEEKTDALLVSTEEERKILEPLIKSCGKQVDFLKETNVSEESVKKYSYIVTTSDNITEQFAQKKKVFAVGTNVLPQKEQRLSGQKDAQVSFSFGAFTQTAKKRKGLYYLEDVNVEHTFGSMKLMSGKEAPYSIVSGGDGYASYAKYGDLSSIALSSALHTFFDVPQSEGKLYVMFDEIYPFTDSERLIKQGEDLNASGIPYLLRVMPVYENHSYPEYADWADRLSYLQTKGGAVVMHEPLDTGETEESEQELDSKLLFAKSSLEQRGIQLYPTEKIQLTVPFQFFWEVKSETRKFQTLPVDTVLVLPIYETEEEWKKTLDFLNEKWLTASDYRDEFEKEYTVYKKPTGENDDFVYREKEEAGMKGFFDRSNRILLYIVGVTIAAYLLILISSRKIYQKKFREKEKEENE